MRPIWSFVVLSFCFLAFLGMAIVGDMPYWAWFIPTGVGIMATLAVFRGSYLPQSTVTRGMALIQAQDYNNRLVKVGEPNSDRIVALFNSLIDKLRAERLLNREQESFLKLLIEASPMGVVILDFDSRISMVNQSFLKISGILSTEDLKGKKIKEIDNELISDILKIPLGKSEIIRKGNFKIFRVYHLNFIQEGFKREFYLIESLTEEIMKAEKRAYEKVIRTISHEVNNTLGGVRSVLEIAGENCGDEEIRSVMESCDRRCESLGNFISEYAEVVKLPLPVMDTLDLNREISTFTPFLRQMMPERISLDFKVNPEKLSVKGDRSQLQQVILNIVKNAVESIENEGFIKIESYLEGNKRVLEISNNGLPIDPDVISQLFTPFYTTKPEGKGIGLTLVREVLANHGAEYSLYTDGEGITRFKILFLF